MEITKSEFEAILSVATSSHVEVYEKVEPHFAASYDECKADVLGDVGTSAAEGENNEKLTVAVKRWVAIHAFLAVFRQLDLVLTPTGFGVVSSNQMAPASKQRVDALIGHLRDSILIARGQLLAELCHVSRWGTTTQALENIDNLFFDFRMLQKMQGPAASHLEWQAAEDARPCGVASGMAGCSAAHQRGRRSTAPEAEQPVYGRTPGACALRHGDCR